MAPEQPAPLVHVQLRPHLPQLNRVEAVGTVEGRLQLSASTQQLVELASPFLEASDIPVRAECVGDAGVITVDGKIGLRRPDLVLHFGELRRVLERLDLEPFELREELLHHILLDPRRHGRVGRLGTQSLTRSEDASVAAVAALPAGEIGLCPVTTASATQQARQQRRPAIRARHRGPRALTLRTSPSDRIGQRLVRKRVNELAVERLAEIDPIADQVLDCPTRPLSRVPSALDALAVRPPGDLRPGIAPRGAAKQLAHSLGVPVRAQWRDDLAPLVRLARISGRRHRRRMDTPCYGTLPRIRKNRPEAIDLALGDRQQEAKQHLARLVTSVDPVARDGQKPLRLLDPRHGLMAAELIAEVTIELRDHHPVYLARLDQADTAEQLGAFLPALGVHVLHELDDLGVIRCSPLADRIPLPRRTDERRPCAPLLLGNADIADDS